MKLSLRKGIPLFCIAFAMHQWSQAQNTSITYLDSVQSLEEVVVTEFKKPAKEAYRGKQVQVLNEKDLEKFRGMSLGSLINTLSGMVVQGSQSPRGATQSIYARAGRSKQVLILVDGQRMADPYSASLSYDLRLLDVSVIEKIEVLKGANSTLYGTNAAAAVISIKTKREDKKPLQLVVNSQIGTQMTADKANYGLNDSQWGALMSGSLNDWHYILQYHQGKQDGVSSLVNTTEEDPYTHRNARFEIGKQSGVLSYDFFGTYARMNASYDDSFSGIDAPFHFSTKQNSMGTKGSWLLQGVTLVWNAAKTTYHSEDESSYGGTFESNTSNADIYLKKEFSKVLGALIGVQYSKDASNSINTSSYHLVDPYMNVNVSLKNQLNINSGIRLNRHSTYGSHWVGHLNPSYSLGSSANKWTIFGSWSSAYITPSLFQLYGEWGANPDLKPESNTTVEMGFKWRNAQKTSASLVAFHRDELQAVYWNNETYGYQNTLGATDAQGIEMDFNTLLSERWNLAFNYTFSERFGDSSIRIPKHQLFMSHQIQLAAHQQISINTQWIGARKDLDFSTYTEVNLKSYTLIDVMWNKEIPSIHLKVNARISNLLNSSYTEQIGFTTLGRNASMGLTYTVF